MSEKQIIKKGDLVKLISFNGQIKPKSDEIINEDENYYILIGKTGIVEVVEERVLVIFNQNLNDFGLINHNEVKNSLWIMKNDLLKL